MPCQKVGKHLDENENYLTTMTSYMIINMLMIMNNIRMIMHTSYLSILVHRRIIEVYKKYTKKLSELATK